MLSRPCVLSVQSQRSCDSFLRMLDARVESELCIRQLRVDGIHNAFEERRERIELPQTH